jgi:hypothetical protein
MHEMDAGGQAHEVDKLTEAQTGRWRVITEDTVYIVDLDKRTVTSELRSDASDGSRKNRMSLRTLHICWVGDPGFWTMNPTGPSPKVDYYWVVTTVIKKITQMNDRTN